jgi:hypothetical protein
MIVFVRCVLNRVFEWEGLKRKNPQELVRGFSEKLEFLMLSLDKSAKAGFSGFVGCRFIHWYWTVRSLVLDRTNVG